MEGYAKVEGHPHLYRDKKTGAIVNMDHQGYRNYKKKQLKERVSRKEIDTLKDQLDESKKQIEELKHLINQMINR
jgi:chaperonin cofactor prefoldin